MKPVWATVIRHEGKTYVLADDDGNVFASRSKREELGRWNNTFREKFSRGQQASVALLLIQIPELRVVRFATAADLKTRCSRGIYQITSEVWRPTVRRVRVSATERQRGVPVASVLNTSIGHQR